MKILKRLMICLTIIILSFSTGKVFQNESKAFIPFVREVELYSKGAMVNFKYKGIPVSVHFVVYQKNGIEYPAYCLDKDLIGVTGQIKMKATVDYNLDNTAIWKTIINGYPYNTASDLLCNSNHEAFAATKMAVYDAIYHYNWNDFEADNEQGKRVLNAAEKISKAAKCSMEDIIIGKINIQPVDEKWKADNIEEGYISRKYEVVTNIESSEYKINLQKANIDGMKVTDENNKENSVFQIGEQFKVLVPISQIQEKDISFELHVTSKLKTKPILYGKTSSVTFQDYALTADIWEYQEYTYQESYLIKDKENDENNQENNMDKEDYLEKESGKNKEGLENNKINKKEVEQKKQILNRKPVKNGENKLQNEDVEIVALPRTGF